jgi:hypothetical protein
MKIKLFYNDENSSEHEISSEEVPTLIYYNDKYFVYFRLNKNDIYEYDETPNPYYIS